MKNWPFAASYERGIALVEARCPIDFLNALPRHSRESVRAEPLAGYAESCVYPLGPSQSGYVIPLRLGTDRAAGSIIADWSFVLPWEDHIVFWDSAPEEVIPKRLWGAYQRFFDSRLMGVLNEHRLLRRGCPVDGLLCGRSFQPIKESAQGLVSAKLILQDDIGNTVAVRLRLSVSHPPADRWRARTVRTGPFVTKSSRSTFDRK